MPELKLTDMNQRTGIDKVQFFELQKLIKNAERTIQRHGTIC